MPSEETPSTTTPFGIEFGSREELVEDARLAGLLTVRSEILHHGSSNEAAVVNGVLTAKEGHGLTPEEARSVYEALMNELLEKSPEQLREDNDHFWAPVRERLGFAHPPQEIGDS